MARDDDGPIGRVLFAEGAIIATLVRPGEWEVLVGQSLDDRMAAALEAYYLGWPDGPEAGHPGQAILRDLAERTGGTLTLRPFPMAGPDEIN